MRRRKLSMQSPSSVLAVAQQHLLTVSLLLWLPSAGAQSQSPSVRVVVDASKAIGKADPTLWGNIGYDPIYRNTVQPEFRNAWEMVKNSRGFRYIRCHNMFSDGFPGQLDRDIYGCRIYSEDSVGGSRFNWRYLDQVLDTWLQAGCKPILETDFMPDALAAGAIVRNYSGGALNPPKDYAKWRELVYQTVKHCEEGYGRDEVRSWYWEIWNEPDLIQYFIGTVNDLTKMYDYFVAGATAADSLIKIGGPGVAGNETFFRAFLNHCANGTNYVTGKRGTRIDFISWHAYGTLTAIMNKTRRMRSIILNEFPSLAHCEFQQNEWGQRLEPNLISPMTSHEAGFLAKFIDAIYSDSTLRIDKFLRWGSPVSVAQRGFGAGWRTHANVVKEETIPLSVFNAYEMLGKMGAERVLFTGPTFGDTVRGFATRSGFSSGSPLSTEILLYHFQEANVVGNGDSAVVNLTVKGFGNINTVVLTHYRIDRNHGDAYSLWVSMGSPASLTDQQIQQLKAKSTLQQLDAPSRLNVDQGQVRLSFKLPLNAVSLLVLSNATVTGINVDPEGPVHSALYQNYPNPLSARGGSPFGGNPTTAISYQLSAISFVTLKVFDILGREVATLVDEVHPSGRYTVRWDGLGLPSGVYFYRLSTSAWSEQKSMVLIR